MTENVTALLRANQIGDLPKFGEFASPIGIVGGLASFVVGGGMAYRYTGMPAVSALAGLISVAALWAAQRYHERGQDNEGFHPLTDPPTMPVQKSRVGGMDAELTGIYRAVYSDESIAVERMDSHPRFIVHVIHHDDVNLGDNKRLRKLARMLNIKTPPKREPPFQMVYSWGNGASAIIYPRVIEKGEKLPIIPFRRNLIQPGKLISYLGDDISGEPIQNDRQTAPHLMISGMTGAGKTILFRNEIWSQYIACPNARIFSIDYKEGIRVAPHTEFAKEPREGISLLLRVLDVARENWRIVSDAGFDNWFEYDEANPGKLSPIFINIDEYEEFQEEGDRMLLEEWEEEKAAAKEAKQPIPVKPLLVNDITRKFVRVFRAGGCFVTLGFQHPDAKRFPTSFTNMFDARAAMRVFDGDASKVAIDVTGAEELPDRGGVMFRLASNPIQIGAAAFITPEQRKELLKAA